MLGLFGLAASSSTQAQQAKETDVCSLVAHPEQFNKEYVRVRAQMISGMHGAVLLDTHCKYGVTLWIADSARDNPDFKALDDVVVHHGNLGTVGKTIMGTFTGQFLRYPKPKGPERKKLLVLEANHVENLDVKYDKP